MGSSNSTVKNVNNQTYINKSQVDILNKQITNQIANTQMNNASKCGANMIQDQQITISNITAAGPITINDINQFQNNSISFSCSQNQQARTAIANQLYQEMINNLQNSNSTNIMAELEAQAATNVKNGFASWGGGSSHSDTDNTVNWNVQNSTFQELQNVIENSIENNFTANNLAECNNSVTQNQLLDINNVHSTGGSVWIGNINQQQASNSYVQCIQNQGVAQEITNVILNATSTKVEDDTSNSGSSTQKGSATAETINNGPFESLGEMFSSIFSGLGSLFNNTRASSIVCVIICGLVICCFVIAVAAWFIQSGFTPQQAVQTAQLAALGGASMSGGDMPLDYAFTDSSMGMTVATNSFSEFGLRY